MSTHILVPLDGSALAERALPTAVSLVKQRHGRLELAFVHEPSARGGIQDAPWNAMSESMQDRYVTDKAEQLSEACDGPVGHALLHGDVAREICERARAVDADLIVMGSHGRTGLTRALAGSVADEVIRESNIPVMVLRQPDLGPATARPPLDFRKILIPVDNEPQSRQIVDAAVALATEGITQLVLLHIVAPVQYVIDATPPYGYVSGPRDERATEELVAAADRDLKGLAAHVAAHSGCRVDPHVIVSDHTGTAIVDFAKKYDVDLIAMTTRGRGVARLMLGSATDVVLRSATIPMLVLRATYQ